MRMSRIVVSKGMGLLFCSTLAVHMHNVNGMATESNFSHRRVRTGPAVVTEFQKRYFKAIIYNIETYQEREPSWSVKMVGHLVAICKRLGE